MLDVFRNSFKNNKYYICLYDNNIYIYNYIEILTFTNEIIIIRLNNQNVKIKGSDLTIRKMEYNEILISGQINGVNYE